MKSPNGRPRQTRLDRIASTSYTATLSRFFPSAAVTVSRPDPAVAARHWRITAMTASTAESLSRTPLFDWHTKNGARIVPFAGWEMPIQYTTIIDEHQAVRTGAGLSTSATWAVSRSAAPTLSP